MSTKSRASQFATLLRQFLTQVAQSKFFEQPATFNDYDGPDFLEAKEEFAFVRDLYGPLIDTDRLAKLPFPSLAQLQGVLQNCLNTFQQLVNARDQGSFQNFAVNLASFAMHTRMYGVPYIGAGGDMLEASRSALANELEKLQRGLERLQENNTEVEQLKKDVRTLIAPAVAGSLSKSFTERAESLKWARIIWLAISVFVGGIAIYGTYDFAKAIGEVLIKYGSAANQQALSLWPVIAIRSIVLLPLFAAFGFAISQYRKERDFEEEYAHKAAVAVSLPNYGDLAREPTVRDQIVTAAASLIFTSPAHQSKETVKSDEVIGGIREIIESVGKVIPRR
jgi:hypothetical protein